MTKPIARIVFSLILCLIFPAAVAAQSSHSIWSKKPLLVKDGQTNTEYNSFVKGNAALAWKESTLRGYAHAVAVITANLRYDFMLIKTTSSNADEINGLWDVRRNGVLVCHNCIGKAYMLAPSQIPPGNYFKIYVGTPTAYAEKWFYSGDKTERFDF